MDRPSWTHVAFVDESNWNRERYRSLCAVTALRSRAVELHHVLGGLLQQSGVGELQWKKVRTARDRFAAIKVVDAALEAAVDTELRIDVVVWDTHDSRHRIRGRDDIANLQRMYFHLLRNVLDTRWADGLHWALLPDERTDLDWTEASRVLMGCGTKTVLNATGPVGRLPSLVLRLRHSFTVEKVLPSPSKGLPLLQLADLFAGLTAYSHNSHDRFRRWRAKHQVAGTHQERSIVLQHLLGRGGELRLGIDLEQRQGLWTPAPSKPINFWCYTPKHPADKAPVRLLSGEGASPNPSLQRTPPGRSPGSRR
jgi:hypothetical protein